LTTFEGRRRAEVLVFRRRRQLQQLNYAQIIIELYNKDDTPKLVGAFQDAISKNALGARVDVRQLQTNPVDYPVECALPGSRTSAPLDRSKGYRHVAVDRRQSNRHFERGSLRQLAFAMMGTGRVSGITQSGLGPRQSGGRDEPGCGEFIEFSFERRVG